MASPTGYTLDQLLDWSLEDRLIDYYERAGNRLVIVQGKVRREFSTEEARRFLKESFKRSEFLQQVRNRAQRAAGLSV